MRNTTGSGSPESSTLDNTSGAHPPPGPVDHARRDGESLLIMGGFFAMLGAAVLVGTFWNEPGKGLVVNVVAGAALLVAGGGAAAFGRRFRRRSGTSAERTTP